MRIYQILVAFLLLSGTDGSTGPWNLRTATARIPATQLKDFRHSSYAYTTTTSNSHRHDASSLVRGGDQASKAKEEETEHHEQSDEAKISNASEDISRGGGAYVKQQKGGDVEVHSPRGPPPGGANATTATTSKTAKKVTKTQEATSSKAKTKLGTSSVSSNQTLSSSKKAFATNTEEPKERKGLSRLLPHRKNAHHKSIAKKLKNRNATNLRRKVLHASFGLFFASLNHFLQKETFVAFTGSVSVLTLALELLRYRKGFGWMNNIMHWILGSSLRKHEMDGKFTGSLYYFTGVCMTSYLFPKTCATLGICQLALADPSASYFGRATRHIYWSRIENGLGGFGRNKGILGFLGGAAFCFPFNYRMLSIAKFGAKGIPGGQTSLVLVSAALGLAGAFADLAVPTPAWTLPKRICGVRVPPFHLDDNFVVPIFSAFACTKIFDAVGWSQNLPLGTFLLV